VLKIFWSYWILLINFHSLARELNQALAWLVTTDPLPNHNRARVFYEPQTGKWLSRGQEYKDWENVAFRFFWLHGIPDAGKSILFSYVVEDMKGFCQREPGITLAMLITIAISPEDMTKHPIYYAGLSISCVDKLMASLMKSANFSAREDSPTLPD
jgi:hypothetical protein